MNIDHDRAGPPDALPAVMTRAHWLGLLATFLVFAGGCSNPRCWTHDSWEVEGGCHVFGGSSRSRAPETPQEIVTANERACAAQNPTACGTTAEALETLRAPAKDIEAKYTVACAGDNPSKHWCLKAGTYALQRGDGEAAALELFMRGCAIQDGSACARAATLDLIHADALITTACRFHDVDSCVTLVSIHADPTDPDHREAMVLGCKHSLDDACRRLGRFDAVRNDDQHDAATDCKRGDPRACIKLGRAAAAR